MTISVADGISLPDGGGGGSGTVTSVSVVTANGLSGTVANATTTPAITLTASGLAPSVITGTAATLGANTFTDTQTVTQATANHGILASTGYSLTGSNATSAVNFAGTLNTSGVVDVEKSAITDTAHGAGSNLRAWYGGASGTTLAASIGMDGSILTGAADTVFGLYFGGKTDSYPAFRRNGATLEMVTAGGTNWGTVKFGTLNLTGSVNVGGGILQAGTGGLSVVSGVNYGALNVNSVAIQAAGGGSTAYLTQAATATLQLGAAPNATPVANKLLVGESSRATVDTNTGGANGTIASGQGTGTGTLSTLTFQTPIAVASGSGAQTMTTGLTIKAGVPIRPSYTVANLPAAATVGAGAMAWVTDATATTFLSTVAGGGSNKVPVSCDGTNWLIG